jgi:hypothetical protein
MGRTWAVVGAIVAVVVICCGLELLCLVLWVDSIELPTPS